MRIDTLGAALAILTLGATPFLVEPESVSAQISPADSAAVLLATALTFELEERWVVAEALYRHILARYAGTPAAARALERLGGASTMAAGSGATELQVWTTMYGLWLGVAIPGALGARDSEPYGVGLLLGGPAGFISGRVITRAKSLSIGQARAITLGGSWGTWQGFGWREVFDIGTERDCFEFGCFDSGDTEEETFGAMIVGGAIGIATGALLSRKPVSNAAATAANFGSLLGSWVGAAGGVIFDLEDDDLLAATLIVGNAGLVSAALAAPGLGWSRSRWRVVGIASLLGGLGGFGIDLLAQPDDDRVAAAIPLATSLIGLGVGVASSAGDLGARDGEAQPAFLNVSSGALRFGTATPYPTLRRVDGPRGTYWTPAVGVTLFHAVF